MKALDIESTKQQYLQFVEGIKSLVISTVDEQGEPCVSYAPYVKKDDKLYIYISHIANHFRHLQQNNRLDVMMIADETATPNLFARQRARFACTAAELGNDGYDDIFELFGQSFGKKMIEMLRGLDFSLFELTASEGRYVAGFGQAFDIDLSGNRFDHVARDGHKAKS